MLNLHIYVYKTISSGSNATLRIILDQTNRIVKVFKGVFYMTINHVVIDANQSVGKNLVLVDVAPVRAYVEGKRTDEVTGYRYTVALPDKAFDKLVVKIDGVQRLDKPVEGNYPKVVFDNLDLSLYWTPEGHKISAKADDIKAVEGKDKG